MLHRSWPAANPEVAFQTLHDPSRMDLVDIMNGNSMPSAPPSVSSSCSSSTSSGPIFQGCGGAAERQVGSTANGLLPSQVQLSPQNPEASQASSVGVVVPGSLALSHSCAPLRPEIPADTIGNPISPLQIPSPSVMGSHPRYIASPHVSSNAAFSTATDLAVRRSEPGATEVLSSHDRRYPMETQPRYGASWDGFAGPATPISSSFSFPLSAQQAQGWASSSSLTPSGTLDGTPKSEPPSVFWSVDSSNVFLPSPQNRIQQSREKMKRYAARVKRQRQALSELHESIDAEVGRLGHKAVLILRQATQPMKKGKAIMPESSETPAFASAAEKLNYQKRASKARKRANETSQVEAMSARADYALRHLEVAAATAAAAATLQTPSSPETEIALAVVRALTRHVEYWDDLIDAEKRWIFSTSSGSRSRPSSSSTAEDAVSTSSSSSSTAAAAAAAATTTTSSVPTPMDPSSSTRSDGSLAGRLRGGATPLQNLLRFISSGASPFSHLARVQSESSQAVALSATC